MSCGVVQVSVAQFGCRWRTVAHIASAHGRGSLFYVNGLLHYSLMQVFFSGQDLAVTMDTGCPVTR